MSRGGIASLLPMTMLEAESVNRFHPKSDSPVISPACGCSYGNGTGQVFRNVCGFREILFLFRSLMKIPWRYCSLSDVMFRLPLAPFLFQRDRNESSHPYLMLNRGHICPRYYNSERGGKRGAWVTDIKVYILRRTDHNGHEVSSDAKYRTLS